MKEEKGKKNHQLNKCNEHIAIRIIFEVWREKKMAKRAFY